MAKELQFQTSMKKVVFFMNKTKTSTNTVLNIIVLFSPDSVFQFEKLFLWESCDSWFFLRNNWNNYTYTCMLVWYLYKWHVQCMLFSLLSLLNGRNYIEGLLVLNNTGQFQAKSQLGHQMYKLRNRREICFFRTCSHPILYQCLISYSIIELRRCY